MTMQLSPGGARSIRRNSQIVRIISGHAWITFDGKDLYLDSDEELSLAPRKSHAVISALGGIPLIYEIE